MSSTLVFNPLTAIEYLRDQGGPALATRSFARGRSWSKTVFRQGDDPELYARLCEWPLDGRPPSVADLGREQTLALWLAGLLVSPDELERQPRVGKPVVGEGGELAIAIMPSIEGVVGGWMQVQAPPSQCAQDFARDDFCLVPPLFEEPDACAIADWYRGLTGNQWLKRDGHLTVQRVLQNDPVARAVQRALALAVETVMGRPMVRSLTYASEYHSGAPLPRHLDRAEAEYVVSLFVNYVPLEPGRQSPWPLILHTPKGDVALHHDRLGWVLFHGRVLPHSRPPLPEGHRALVVSMAYVDEGYEGPLE